MCAYSAILDNVTRPYLTPLPAASWPNYATRQELYELRAQFEREIAALRELLPHVQKYDAETGQPDCESDEKLKLLRAIGEKLGVDVSGVA